MTIKKTGFLSPRTLSPGSKSQVYIHGEYAGRPLTWRATIEAQTPDKLTITFDDDTTKSFEGANINQMVNDLEVTSISLSRLFAPGEGGSDFWWIPTLPPGARK